MGQQTLKRRQKERKVTFMKSFRILALVATMALGLTVGAYAQSEENATPTQQDQSAASSTSTQSEKSATSTQQDQSAASSTSTAAEHIQDAMNDGGAN